jgi:hypothetical protein
MSTRRSCFCGEMTTREEKIEFVSGVEISAEKFPWMSTKRTLESGAAAAATLKTALCFVH